MRKGRFICVCVEDGPFIGTDGGIFHDGPDLGAEVVDRLNQGLGVSLCFHEPTVVEETGDSSILLPFFDTIKITTK